ncbi:MAG: ATP synthase protein I [Halieaceae bacterium]
MFSVSSGREKRGAGAAIGRPSIVKIALGPIVALVLISSGLIFVSPVLSYSVFLGGAVAVLPQVFFAVKVFRYAGASSAANVARSSYVGEVGKFALSAAGFALIFAWVEPLRHEAVLMGFMFFWVLQYVGTWLLLRPLPGIKVESTHGS